MLASRGLWGSNTSWPDWRELDTLYQVGGVAILWTHRQRGRDFHTHVGLSRAGDLLQRYDHPAYHHRDIPIEIRIDQPRIGHCANQKQLTPRSPCPRGKKDHQKKISWSDHISEDGLHNRYGPDPCLGKRNQRSAWVELKH